jgi:hypothetical protein
MLLTLYIIRDGMSSYFLLSYTLRDFDIFLRCSSEKTNPVFPLFHGTLPLLVELCFCLDSSERFLPDHW